MKSHQKPNNTIAAMMRGCRAAGMSHWEFVADPEHMADLVFGDADIHGHFAEYAEMMNRSHEPEIRLEQKAALIRSITGTQTREEIEREEQEMLTHAAAAATKMLAAEEAVECARRDLEFELDAEEVVKKSKTKFKSAAQFATAVAKAKACLMEEAASNNARKTEKSRSRKKKPKATAAHRKNDFDALYAAIYGDGVPSGVNPVIFAKAKAAVKASVVKILNTDVSAASTVTESGEDDPMCCVCLEHHVQVAYVKCGHVCACVSCARAVAKVGNNACPYCREPDNPSVVVWRDGEDAPKCRTCTERFPERLDSFSCLRCQPEMPCARLFWLSGS